MRRLGSRIMNKPDRLLVRGAVQLVTLRGPAGPRRGPSLGALNVVENGALLIRDGLIEHVGPSHRVENLVESRRALEIDASGCVVLPGFVDCSTRLLNSRPAFAAASASSALMTAGRLRSQAQHLLRWMAMHGTTTAEVSSACGPDDSSHAKALRVLQNLDGEPIEIVRTVTPAPCRAPEGCEKLQEWLMNELIPALARRKFATFAGASVGDGHTRRCSWAFLEAARAAGLGLRIRASPQSPAEAVRCAVELGAAAVELPGAVSGDALHALAISAAIATLAPGAAFQSGVPELPPARDLIESGAAVALATGFDAASAPSCSMAMTLSLACILLRMTPEEAITAATLNAACSLGCGARTGSLEAGKQADFIIAAVHDYRELPYYFGVQTIARVFRRGVEISPGGNRPLASGAC